MKVFISQIARMISIIDCGDLTLSEKYCPYCGSVARTDDEFCNSCGASIQETAEPAQNQPYDPPAPQQQQQAAYVPPPTHQYGASTQTTYHDHTKQSAQTNNTYGILALLLSIGGFIAVFFMPFASLPMFIVAFILGIVGLKKTAQKAFSIIGMIISSIGILLSIIMAILFILALIYSQ